MDDVPPSPLPLSGELTFNAPGTYPYVCLIHPAMKATVTVQ
jgi:plastocyanin